MRRGNDKNFMNNIGEEIGIGKRWWSRLSVEDEPVTAAEKSLVG